MYASAKASAGVATPEYPAPQRFLGEFDPRLAGIVFWAYVEFAGAPGGKYRPVVLVSVGEQCFHVRALYSKCSRFAGGSRATKLSLAGVDLSHPGFLSPYTIAVPKILPPAVGRISLSDWSLLRFGQFNAEVVRW